MSNGGTAQLSSPLSFSDSFRSEVNQDVLEYERGEFSFPEKKPEIEGTPEEISFARQINENVDSLIERKTKIPYDEMAGHGIISVELAEKAKASQLDPQEDAEVEQLAIDFDVFKLLKPVLDNEDSDAEDKAKYWANFKMFTGMNHE